MSHGRCFDGGEKPRAVQCETNQGAQMNQVSRLTLKFATKRELSKMSVKFLGHCISKEGV